MAKISARGDKEVSRWKRGGATLVHTQKGRLLRKLLPTDGYAIYKQHCSPAEARAIAHALGYAEVPSR